MILLAFSWSELGQQLAAGLASGAIYASLALALVLIYRATRIVNFAQGEMATFATFVAWSLTHHMSFWPAFLVTLVVAFAGGVALERVVIRPFENAPVLTPVIVTIGLALALNGLMSLIWGGASRQFPSAFSDGTVEIAGVIVGWQTLGTIGVTVAVVVLLALFFRFTKLGLGLRAAALNPHASRLVGIRVGWMLALGWGFAAVLGAVAGMLIAPDVSLDPNMMQTILLYAFAAAVLGGLDSPLGAVVGGLLLGVVITLAGRYVDYVGSTLKLPVALTLILLVLLVRPAGLFGRTAVRRV